MLLKLIMRKVYLDNLPKLPNKNVSWKESVGHTVNFIFDDIQGNFHIIDYRTNGVSPEVLIEYKEKTEWVFTYRLINSKISDFIKAPKKIKKLHKDYSGEKFGMLTVIGDDGTRTNNGQIKWLCLCECGNKTHVVGYKLKKGLIRSCGCKMKCNFKPKQKTNEDKEKTAISLIKGRYKAGAKRRGYKWEINNESFEKIVKQPCFYCGTNYGSVKNINGYNFQYNGIDRIDSDKGYNLDNVVPCCRWCNQAKSTMSQSDFYNWVQKIHKNFTINKIAS